MPSPDPPANDDERLRALADSGLLEGAPIGALRALAAEAAEGAAAPVALVTFIGADSAWIKAAVGMSEGETSRHAAFCAWAIHSLEVLWIEDALQDSRYADNPLVLSPPYIRFYAGAPIVTPEGYALGALCVMDHEPRSPDPSTFAMLDALAGRVSQLLFSESAKG